MNWAYKRAYEGVNFRLRSVLGGRFAGLCRPTSIIFLLTERCNAHCVHCDIWKNRGKEDTLNEEEWKTVLRDLRRWLGPVLVYFSGGEALLRPYTPAVIGYASSLGLFPEVLTHGYWEDQSRIEALALARPWCITVSLDALGPVHSLIRGRDGFYEKTRRTIETLVRVRQEHELDFGIRLKTVIMEHNLGEAAEVARFATQGGMRVFYQPIEQNYNTEPDPLWYTTSPNWPRDPEKAVAVVQDLIRLKGEGLHIENSAQQLEAMIPYFRDPAASRLLTQLHSAHERRLLCAAPVNLQFQANGDVRTCAMRGPVGNVRQMPIRKIWQQRPQWWKQGCCLETA